jgi:hypothetical protein
MFDRIQSLLAGLWRRENVKYAAAGAGLGAGVVVGRGVARNIPLIVGLFRNLFAAGEAAFEAVIVAITSPTLRATLGVAWAGFVAELRDQWSRLQGAVSLVILVTVLSAFLFPIFTQIPFGWVLIWCMTGLDVLLVGIALAARAGFLGALAIVIQTPATPSGLRQAVAAAGRWALLAVSAMLAVQLGLVIEMLVIPWQAGPFVLAAGFACAYFLFAALAVSRVFAVGQTSGRRLATAGMVMGMGVMGTTAGLAFLLSGFSVLNSGVGATVSVNPATGTTPAPGRFSPGQLAKQLQYKAAKGLWDWVHGNPDVPDSLSAVVPRAMAGQSLLPSISTPPADQTWALVGEWEVSAKDHQAVELARDLEPGWYILVAAGKVETRQRTRRHEPPVTAEPPGSDFHELAHYGGMQAAYGQAMIRLTSAMEERWLYVNPQARSGLYWTAFPNRAQTWQTAIYASNYCRVGVLVMDDDHREYPGDPRVDNEGKYKLALYRVATPGAREASVEDLPRPRRSPSLPWDRRTREAVPDTAVSLSWGRKTAE